MGWTIEAFLQHIIDDPNSWEEWLRVRDEGGPDPRWSDPPTEQMSAWTRAGFEYPGPTAEFERKQELHGSFVKLLRERLRDGSFQVTGRIGGMPPRSVLEETDLDRLAPNFAGNAFGNYRDIEIALISPKTDADFLRGEISDISVSASEIMGAAQNCHADKAKLRAELRRWFEEKVNDEHPPQSIGKWRTAAESHFSQQGLTKNLFNGIWEEMSHPHPLKLNWREGVI